MERDELGEQAQALIDKFLEEYRLKTGTSYPAEGAYAIAGLYGGIYMLVSEWAIKATVEG